MISYLDEEILVSSSFGLILQSYNLRFAEQRHVFENSNLQMKLNYCVCCLNLPLSAEFWQFHCIFLN